MTQYNAHQDLLSLFINNRKVYTKKMFLLLKQLLFVVGVPSPLAARASNKPCVIALVWSLDWDKYLTLRQLDAQISSPTCLPGSFVLQPWYPQDMNYLTDWGVINQSCVLLSFSSRSGFCSCICQGTWAAMLNEGSVMEMESRDNHTLGHIKTQLGPECSECAWLPAVSRVR